MNWQAEPPAARALYEAYVKATNLALSWSYQRSQDVGELVRRNITSEDVAAVLGFVKKKMARGDGGFGETSMLWRNAMAPDAMEERALLVRQARGRKPAAKAPVSVTDASGTTRLLPSTATAPRPAGSLVAGVLALIEEQRTKGGS